MSSGGDLAFQGELLKPKQNIQRDQMRIKKKILEVIW